MKKICFVLFALVHTTCFSQQPLGTLTVEKIMRDPKWIGTSPTNPYWSVDGSKLFFAWNPDNSLSDSIYYINVGQPDPQKASYQVRRDVVRAAAVTYNSDRSLYAYIQNGDVYYADTKTNTSHRVTQTADAENNPVFVQGSNKIAYRSGSDLYTWDLKSGLTTQLTSFQKGAEPPTSPKKDSLNQQERWLVNDQLQNFEVLKDRKYKKDRAEAAQKLLPKETQVKAIYLGDKNVSNVQISPNGLYITYRLSTAAVRPKNTIIPNYVTESGFTQDINGRTKVGAPEGGSEMYLFDVARDTIIKIKTDSLPGIRDLPDYAKDYATYDSLQKKPPVRKVSVSGPWWNDNGTYAVVEVFSNDNKDRWITLLNTMTGSLALLDRQRDEAWIGGPGISSFSSGDNRWVDSLTYYYESEATGYAHLYTINVVTNKKKQLTQGNYEVQEVTLSNNKKYFYITTNQVHPGEKQFYRLPSAGGAAERLTGMTGANQVVLSPNEKHLAILYSYSNKPWELYVQENKPSAQPVQVTNKAQTDEFRSYAWRDPELISFKAGDGATVYARLYRAGVSNTAKPAVIFVHGAGYLQNAHKWWSSYFREYMFHNLLADAGYTVMDVDYRGSAGYGRDWRTGIYRFMGGKDLSDQVDAAKYLVDSLGINKQNIGIYGGSYGGFITLMAMFTKPGVFAAGAGLRSVTDWAHYNHPYTSNILNEPYNDSIAYKKSSPLYYAEGLQGNLLMCHGMVDLNVHFQDIVRLTQRLIELKKDNWELAVYPMEDHGFVEPSSWTDEYKRILKLFNESLMHQ